MTQEFAICDIYPIQILPVIEHDEKPRIQFNIEFQNRIIYNDVFLSNIQFFKTTG